MGEHSINPKPAGHMNILHHSVAKSRHSFTSRAGLMVPAMLLERLGLGEPALAGLMGFRSLPCAATLGGWLQRVGRSQPSRDVLQEAVAGAGCRRRPCRAGTG